MCPYDITEEAELVLGRGCLNGKISAGDEVKVLK